MMQFKRISIAFVLVFSVAVGTLFSQQNENDNFSKSILIHANQENIFDEVVDYLIGKEYFILSLDKDVGFIQAKVFTENKKLLSAKIGDKRTLNFFIKAQDKYFFKVVLDMYVEEQFFSGDGANRVYYYKEKGRPEDQAVYKDILEDLQKFIEMK